MLELRVSLLFDDASLEEVLSYIEQVSGLTVHIHEDRLDQVEDAKLTLRAHELPLRVVLELVLLNAKLGDAHLEWDLATRGRRALPAVAEGCARAVARRG